jgi:protein-L-isoaspartate(D-aspartate) O-methyltransferase
MIDFADARQKMIDSQLRPSDVTDPDLLAVMRDLPRERFVPAGQAAIAYLDRDVPVLESAGRPVRSMLKPVVLARLVQAAQATGAERALVVGCATGYSAAVLSRLVGEVFALEEDAALARQAREALKAIGAANVSVVTDRLTGGWPASAPYDVIVVDGAMEIEPVTLIQQLKEGGRLVGVLGCGGAGSGMLYRIDRGEVSAVPVFNAAAPALPGFQKTPAFVF